jgi:hypothetical protein
MHAADRVSTKCEPAPLPQGGGSHEPHQPASRGRSRLARKATSVEISVADAHALKQLMAYLRDHGYLVVKRDRSTISVQPLNSVSERHDRSVLERDLREWRADNRGVIVELS